MQIKKVIIHTGKKCSISGEWAVEGPITTVIYISKGQLMPEYCGKKVQWILINNG